MPSTDLTEYLDDRASPMRPDRVLRVDVIKLDGLTPIETSFDEILRAMRAEEAVSVWRAEYEHIEHPFPGTEFLTSRPVIMKTKILGALHKVSPSRFFILVERVV